MKTIKESSLIPTLFLLFHTEFEILSPNSCPLITDSYPLDLPENSDANLSCQKRDSHHPPGRGYR
jgi:hypothetical protein